MGADHQHLQAGLLGLDIPHQLQPAAVFQGNIRDHQVRLERADGAQCLGGVFLLTAHDQVALLVDQLGDAVAHHRMVVHEQDSRPVVLDLIVPR